MAVQLLRELCSQLTSLGLEILSPEFVSSTMGCCRKGIANVYAKVDEDISTSAGLQLLADIFFLEIALSSPADGEFGLAKQRLSDKVSWILNKTD